MSKMLACQDDKSPQREGSGCYAAIIEPASPEVNGLRNVIPAPDSWAVAPFTCAVARYRVLEIFSHTAGDSFLNCSPLPKANSLLRT
jgi:hypothetical protein